MNLKTYIRKRRDIAQARKPTTHEKLSKLPYINPQSSSTLFGLPGEIRKLIYDFALSEYPDLARPYRPDSFHYRPGYTHARRINTNLLLTCRRLYLKVGHLALSLNEHLIYQPINHGPPGHKPYLLAGAKRVKGPIAKPKRGLLRSAQRDAIRKVHIYCQQCWLEDWNLNWSKYCFSWSRSPALTVQNGTETASHKSRHPPALRITIRHSDWWYFLLGRSSPLALDAKRAGRAFPGIWVPEDAPFEPGSWGSLFVHLSGLQVFELELETLTEKKAELEAVVEKARGWRFALGDGSELRCRRDAISRTTWTGPSLLSRSLQEAVDNALLREAGDLSHRNSEEYYVVTLTWHSHPGTQTIPRTDSNGGRQLENIGTGAATQEDEDSDSTSGLEDDTPDPASNAPTAVVAPPAQGLFGLNVARAPMRDAIPTYYG